MVKTQINTCQIESSHAMFMPFDTQTNSKKCFTKEQKKIDAFYMKNDDK